MAIGLKHIYLKKRGLLSGASMLLTHQTFATTTKSQKYFCVKWHTFIQRSQTLFGLEYSIFGVLTIGLLIIAEKVINSNYNMIPLFVPQFL